MSDAKPSEREWVYLTAVEIKQCVASDSAVYVARYDYDRLAAELAEANLKIENLKPVPLCGSLHAPPIGYTSSLDSKNCVVCKETSELELLVESYRAKLANLEDAISNLDETHQASRNYLRKAIFAARAALKETK